VSPFQADPSSLAASSATQLPGFLAGARVLIAEDNEVNLEVAKFHLENLGCATTSAVNGAAALDCARQAAFDFVLMDCQMPVMNGFEALTAIRQVDQNLKRQRTPIIAVTAADDPDTQRECDAAGFDGFLAKPYSAEQLRSALSRCLSQGSADASAAARPDTPAQSGSHRSVDVATFRAFIDDFGIDAADMLLKPFVALLRETAVRLDAAAANDDMRALQALSHKVAGASGTVGATGLSQQARKIEGLCKRGARVAATDIADLRSLVTMAEADFVRLLEPRAIADFINTAHS